VCAVPRGAGVEERANLPMKSMSKKRAIESSLNGTAQAGMKLNNYPTKKAVGPTSNNALPILVI